MSKKIVGFVFIAVGVYMILNIMGINCLEIIQFEVWRQYIIPGLFILIGLMIAFGGNKKKAVNNECCDGNTYSKSDNSDSNHTSFDNNASSDNIVKITTAFSNNNYNYDGQHFDGARIEVLTGGVKIDIRNAILPDSCLIIVSALMGGAEIYVPDDCNVKIDSSSMLGGVDRKHVNHTDSPYAKTINIRANCLLGGVTII